MYSKIIYETKYYDCNNNINNNEQDHLSFLTRTTRDFVVCF